MVAIHKVQQVLAVGSLALVVSVGAVTDGTTCATLSYRRPTVEPTSQRDHSAAWLAKVTNAVRHFRGLDGSVSAVLAPLAELDPLDRTPNGLVRGALVLGPAQPIAIRDHLTDLPPPTSFG